MSGRRLLLVDGNSLANRAFYALPPLSTYEGVATGAVFGFLTMLFRFLVEKKPTHVLVAFDHPSPTFRHAEYGSYKATRKPSPEEFKAQMPLLKEVLDVLNLPHTELAGYEADDIIGTLARKRMGEDFTVTILSGDKDCLQLVDEHVEAVLPVKGISQVRHYGPEAVRSDVGVTPSQVRDLKALAGDPSDNIPGVKGIGEKTAAALLRDYRDLEDIYDHLPEVIPLRVRNLLEANRESAFLSKRLATIDTDVPIPDGDASLEWRGPDLERTAELFRRLQFHTLLSRLGALKARGTGEGSPAEAVRETRATSEAPHPGSEEPQDEGPHATSEEPRPVSEGPRTVPGSEPRIVDTEAALEELADRIRRAGRMSIYAGAQEATGEFAWPDTIGISFGDRPHLIRLTGDRTTKEEAMWRSLSPVIVDPAVSKVGFDLKWVFTLCFGRGIVPRGRFFDALVAAYLLDPTRTGYRLEDLVRKHTGAEIPELPPAKSRAAARPGAGDLAAGSNEGLFDAEGGALHYALGAGACFAVAEGCRKDLKGAGLTGLAEEVEFPLIEVLAAMEAMGIRVDLELGRSIRQGFADALSAIEEAIYNMAGEKMNLDSPKQLSHVLFDKLELKPVKKTKTGFSTDAEVLEALSVEHELPAKILEYRQYAKLKSTYLDVLEEVVNPTTGRVHSTFHQTVTSTGRLSSSEPNLQNIPVRGELGRSLRRIFIPAEGRLFLASDYSQIELRIMAHMADDPSMIDAFVRGEDIHARTASEVFGVPAGEVTPDLRNKAKAVNFGIIYGISDYGLARNTGVSRTEARRFIEMYFARYPRVKEYMDAAIEKARRDGYASTLLGRRRAIPEIDSRIRAKRAFAERIAINTPIQGSAADIVKLAMVRIYRRLREQGLVSRLILQVHDELIFEIPPEEEDRMRTLVREEMEGAFELKVPLKVDIDVGKSWFDV